MDIILKKSVDNLGEKDDLVSVKAGYGRNYLIPQGLATLATPSARKVREENIRQRAHKEKALIDEAQKMAAKLKDVAVKIGAKVGENGKIFGSVNTIQLADAIEKLGVAVDRKHIKINGDTIKSVGSYEATIKFHREVIETIKFEVVGE